MSPSTYIVCSFILTFGIPMAFAVREFWTLSPSSGHRRPGEPASPEPSPLPDAGHTSGWRPAKPLPACLIPQPAPAIRHDPIRVRELV